MRKLRSNQHGMGMVELLLILLILIILGALGWYIWKQNNDSKKTTPSSNSKPAPAATPKTTTSTEVTPPKTVCKDPSASNLDNIKASITSGNTAALEGYMAIKVTVIVAASESIGVQTPTQAVTDITSFIGDPTTTTWDFALASSVTSGYAKSFYKTYFPSNAVVGKSSTKKVISFSFDCEGKISTVFEAANEDLLQ